MNQIKIAVLGVGCSGSGKIKALKTNDRVKEIIAYDISEAQLAKVKKELGVEVSQDLDSILADPEIKLCMIASANDGHHPNAMACFAAGKAVMCEKPMATTIQEALEMVETAEAKGLFFQVGFELRYSKLYIKVKEWIDAGLLGEVNNTHCIYICREFHGKGSWRNKLETGGSMFGEKLSHYVDLPRWWIGSEVTDVFSACSPNVVPYYEVRDNYHTTYRFANGAVSHLTFHMAVGATSRGDPLQSEIDQQKGDGHALTYLVVGTKGAAATDVNYRHLKRWEFGDSPESMTSAWVEDLTWDAKEDNSYFHNGKDQVHDIVRRVAEGKPPATPARDAYETMRLCFAADLSADEGRLVKMDEI